jgi:hypothetical protein
MGTSHDQDLLASLCGLNFIKSPVASPSQYKLPSLSTVNAFEPVLILKVLQIVESPNTDIYIYTKFPGTPISLGKSCLNGYANHKSLYQ